MRSRLKKLRLAAGMTQAGVADAMGISQPNYQRWESGTAQVPEGKLKKLARVLGTSADQILGRPAAFDRIGINREVGDDRTYYGEVAVHFTDGNALLLPISELARDSLHYQFQGNSEFVVAESLDNRIVFVRREAVADVYFSSDAYGDSGPGEYPGHMGIWPDDRFWHIMEHMDTPEDLAEDFDAGEIRSALRQIGMGVTRKGKRNPGTQGDPSSTDAVERFFERATNTYWQLTGGTLRREYVFDNLVLFEALNCLQDPDEAEDMILLPIEGYHRSIQIRKAAVAYISVPKHKFHAGGVENGVARSKPTHHPSAIRPTGKVKKA